MDAETIWTFLQLHYIALTDSYARWRLANSDTAVARSPAFSSCCANKRRRYPETERMFVNRKADCDLEACGTFCVEIAFIDEESVGFFSEMFNSEVNINKEKS